MHTAEKAKRDLPQRLGVLPSVRLLYCPIRGVLEETALVLPAGIPIELGRGMGGRRALQLVDPCVSERHALLTHDGRTGTIAVTDRTSRNGTFVNGQPVSTAVLADGDLLRVGDTLLLLRYEPDFEDVGPGIEEVATPSDSLQVQELQGDAPALREIRQNLVRLAPSLASVIIRGESGTGKELAAQALHRLSGRKGRFVSVNCAAIPEQLAESLLFGHVGGAFTGARDSQPGFFVQADGGTLFLDEVGELPGLLQAKLLRVLEDRLVTPLGSTQARTVHVRIVSATNRELDGAGLSGSAGLVGSGPGGETVRFRPDLYARLADVTLQMPPLRERREDILRLFLLGLRRVQQRDKLKKLPGLSVDLAQALVLHGWPLNVRELISVANRYALGLLSADRLARSLGTDSGTLPESQPSAAAVPGGTAARPITGHLLESLLHKHAGHVTHVAQELGLSRRQVGRWCGQLGVDAKRFKRGSGE